MTVCVKQVQQHWLEIAFDRTTISQPLHRFPTQLWSNHGDAALSHVRVCARLTNWHIWRWTASPVLAANNCIYTQHQSINCDFFPTLALARNFSIHTHNAHFLLGVMAGNAVFFFCTNHKYSRSIYGKTARTRSPQPPTIRTLANWNGLERNFIFYVWKISNLLAGTFCGHSGSHHWWCMSAYACGIWREMDGSCPNKIMCAVFLLIYDDDKIEALQFQWFDLRVAQCARA